MTVCLDNIDDIPGNYEPLLWILTSTMNIIGLIIIVAGVTWLGNWLNKQSQET
jgi:hypothetical protein